MTHRDIPRLADIERARCDRKNARIIGGLSLAHDRAMPRSADDQLRGMRTNDPSLSRDLRGIPIAGCAAGTIGGTRPGDSASILDDDNAFLERRSK